MIKQKKNNNTGKNITKFKRVQALKDHYLDKEQKQKCITKDKIYDVIRAGWRNLYIIDDTGTELQLYHDNVSFKYLTA